jgi:hypothetical protein
VLGYLSWLINLGPMHLGPVRLGPVHLGPVHLRPARLRPVGPQAHAVSERARGDDAIAHALPDVGTARLPSRVQTPAAKAAAGDGDGVTRGHRPL